MYHFIVNPNARSGLGKTVWKQLEAILKKENVEYQVHFTQFQKHSTRIVNEITQNEEEPTIVILGGDGSVNEAVNGIHDFSKVIFGYIPIGSSNDFARGLNIPSDPAAALHMILHPTQIIPMDVGVLRFNNKERKFAVSTGLGFDAAICHEAVVSKIKVFLNKIKLGKLTYVLIALHRLFLDKTCRMTVTVDDQAPQTFENAYFGAVMNNLYEGGGFMMCPKADSTDGLLDAIVISDMPKLKILFLLTTAYSGKHVHFKGVHIFQGKHITLESERALAVHTDGEPIFLQRRMEASPSDKKLRVIIK